MKFLIFNIIFLSSFFGRSQQIYPLKETYDQIVEPYHITINDYNNPQQTWWVSWGSILQSYLIMYKTTRDKAYLNKFIKYSYGIQVRRGNNVDWADIITSDQQLHYTGTLLSPMAEFVYIVKSDPDLYSTGLMDNLIPPVLFNPNQTILGYGDYANWLQGRVMETLDHMVDEYWDYDEHVFAKSKISSQTPIQHSLCSSGINRAVNCHAWAAINFQAPYAVVFFYLGFVDPQANALYTVKALNLVEHFKNLVDIYQPNQSYTWFHNEEKYSSDPRREDVAHGSSDLQIPIVATELYGHSLFSWEEMNHFARTFTYNIWDRYNHVFNNNVFGTNFDNDPQTICDNTIFANGDVNFYAPGEVLNWIPLYKFDDSNVEPNDVYSILLNQAVNLLNPIGGNPILPLNYCANTTILPGGTHGFWGLSEVVKAQWEKECVNLTLYNRNVAYDQDFIVKNRLIIAPSQVDYHHYLGQNSFADPITQSNTFDVNSGITVKTEAGESIDLLIGFTAHENSTFSALLNSNSCTDGMRPSNSNNANSKQELFNKSATHIEENKKEYYIQLFPNPAQNKLTIALENETINPNFEFFIYSLSGTLIQNGTGNKRVMVDLNLASGVYLVKVKTSESWYTEKLSVK